MSEIAVINANLDAIRFYILTAAAEINRFSRSVATRQLTSLKIDAALASVRYPVLELIVPQLLDTLLLLLQVRTEQNTGDLHLFSAILCDIHRATDPQWIKVDMLTHLRAVTIAARNGIQHRSIVYASIMSLIHSILMVITHDSRRH